MSFVLKGAVRQVGGKRLVLAYDFNALCDLETDHPDLMNGGMDARKLQSPSYLRGLIYRGLASQIADEAEAGQIISQALGYQAAFVWFQEALGIAFGATEGEAVNPAQAQPQG